MSDLTPFHLTALAKFNGKRALTETGLARELRCEKAVAKHAIRVLLGDGFLKNVGTYEFAITHHGVLKLGGKPKPAVVKEVKLEELEVIDLPETSHDHVADIAAGMGIVSDQAQADVAEAKLNKVVVVSDAQTADQLAEQLAPDPEPAKGVFHDDLPKIAKHLETRLTVDDLPKHDNAIQADFDTLVLQGLARLNRQVETLAALADAIGRTEPHVSIVLKAIINDIQHINGRVG